MTTAIMENLTNVRLTKLATAMIMHRKIRFANMVQKVVIRDHTCILTPQDHKKMMIIDKYICSLSSINITSAQCKCLDKYKSRQCREKTPQK